MVTDGLHEKLVVAPATLVRPRNGALQGGVVEAVAPSAAEGVTGCAEIDMP